MYDVYTFLLITLLHVLMNKHHHHQGVSLYTEVTIPMEVNSTVIHKCHKLLKFVIHKCYQLLNLLYKNVTPY